jgi:hypothetical protein
MTETLAGLTFEQRRGIINLRAREVLQALPAKERNHPNAVELHDLLVTDDRSTKGPL